MKRCSTIEVTDDAEKKRLTRQQDLNDILPPLIQRRNVTTCNTAPQIFQPVPYQRMAPVVVNVATTNRRRGFTIDDILVPQAAPLLVILAPIPPQIQFVHHGFKSNVTPCHSDKFWSPSYDLRSNNAKLYLPKPNRKAMKRTLRYRCALI